VRRSTARRLTLLLVMSSTHSSEPTRTDAHVFRSGLQSTFGAVRPSPKRSSVNPAHSFSPYGGRASTTAVREELGFIGVCDDAETGLIYLNARYYDRAIGRCISPNWLHPASASGMPTPRTTRSTNWTPAATSGVGGRWRWRRGRDATRSAGRLSRLMQQSQVAEPLGYSAGNGRPCCR
jgi:RHS repeat-associated protein